MGRQDAIERIDNILSSGGQARVILLRYCVMSITMEPLFVFLCREYRLRPSHAGALALYDNFCAPGCPARLDAEHMLPPRNLALASSMGTIRRQSSQMQSPQPPHPDAGIPITVPMHGLFDALVQVLIEDPQGKVARLGARYDPMLSSVENLPGGRLTAAQRQFVESIWKPIIRPRLVGAGFWQVQTIE